MYSYEVPEVHTIHKELNHIDGSKIRLNTVLIGTNQWLRNIGRKIDLICEILN